jgi:hypothetical protein
MACRRPDWQNAAMRLSRMLAGVLALAAAAFLAVPTETLARGGSAPSTSPDPKLLVLSLRDLPTGFARAAAGYLSNSDATLRAPVKRDFAKLGRVDGYVAEYRGPAAGYVGSVASTYRNATWGHLAFTRNVGTAKRIKPRARRLRVGVGLGDEARLFTWPPGPGKAGFLVMWRAQSIYASVWESGAPGTLRSRDLVGLARKQQARILRALR